VLSTNFVEGVDSRKFISRKQDVTRATFAFYRDCAAPYAAAHGLSTDTKNLGGFGHGRYGLLPPYSIWWRDASNAIMAPPASSDA
jgi:hypothetical protein